MRYKSIMDVPAGVRDQVERKLSAQGVTTRQATPARNSPPASPAAPTPRRSKYGNVRTEYNGEVFDSKAEAEDDQDLRMQEAAGAIGGYARQVSIPLRARGGKRIKMDWLVNEPRPHACSACGQVDQVMQLILKDTKTKRHADERMGGETTCT